MGAGIHECDVTFTKDTELVCRTLPVHLHTTTDAVFHDDLNAMFHPWAVGVDSPTAALSDLLSRSFKTLQRWTSGGAAA
jgi:glycerophosphoryl diester phosphodiesterase